MSESKNATERIMEQFEKMGEQHFLLGFKRGETEFKAQQLREIIKMLKEELPQPRSLSVEEVLSRIVRIQL